MTKYPIILVHGIVIKDFKHFRAFGKIEKKLINEGFTVYTSKIDGFGTIETNAEQLKQEILKILEKDKVDKINIIAHSKGGLDSKYMIEHLEMSEKIASLTTLCTPHKGSIIATMIMKWPKPITKFMAFWVDFWYRIFGDKHPNSFKTCEQLQRNNNFDWLDLNKETDIYCQSYSTTMNNSKDDFIMGIPHYISKKIEKLENDGLVATDSTMFGIYKGDCLDGSISHSEIVDFMTTKSKKEKIYGFYIELCNDLKNRGF